MRNIAKEVNNSVFRENQFISLIFSWNTKIIILLQMNQQVLEKV